MKKAVFLIFIVLMVIVSTGCKTHVRMPLLWFDPAEDWSTLNAAIAVGPDGAKHLLWADCNTTNGNCKLTYEKTFIGEDSTVTQTYLTESWTPSDVAVPAYLFPDIAVTDGGTVYVVWHYNDRDGHSYDCWNTISAAGETTDNSCHFLNDSRPGRFYYSTADSHPKVIAYENAVYAVYEIFSGGELLEYRQLNPLDASQGRVSESDGGGSENPSLTVSTVGDDTILHVAWSTNNGGTGSVSVYNDNYLSSGDMIRQQINPTDGPRSDPVILAIDEFNRLYYVVIVDDSAGDDMLSLGYCVLPACSPFIGTDSALHPTDDWQLVGNPDMALSGSSNHVRVCFSGTNIKTAEYTDNPEIFLLEYSSGDPFPITTVDRVNDGNDLEESDPRIVSGPTYDYAIFYVVAWRVKGDAPAEFRDFYIYDNYSDSVRTLFYSSNDIMYGYFDIASNGTSFGGIFADQTSDFVAGHAPWVTFNSEALFMPVVVRP